ncbi:hypothetical protein F5J12DRAFT_796980 [Pisolithus orientalis]|uniref:uncharacterized protein n=1 Tax=Pisolithus orientalis TaxID=936130 RepID=UPI002224D34B|nr:uncharacterized protein F5J12DRAFT_796980 [Pisolithus orientalis]KAI6032872.1 hypothetical protein F5J12DRAFT_796980 [Pisolithus orientalis]
MNHMPSPISYDDLLFPALLETGLSGLNRLGELVWPDKVDDQESSKLPWRHVVVILPNCYQFLLPHDEQGACFDGNKVDVQLQAFIFHGHPKHDPPFASI